MAVKISKDRKKIIDKFLNDYPQDSQINIAKRILHDKEGKELFSKLTIRSMETAVSKYCKQNKIERKKPEDVPLPKDKAKSGIEIRGDHVVINWTTKTIITDLGEFGPMICSFDMHNAVQRQYVHMGEGQTAAIVAMNFDFPHAKAIHKYAKIHGFTKSSVPQTDLEFEMGLTVDDAVKQNIQSLKRSTYKKTEQEKWKYIQSNSDKWLNFHHNVLKPFENFIQDSMPKYQPIRIKVGEVKGKKERYASVMGISDWHFMKLCYSPKGEYVYNKEIARKLIKEHALELIKEMLRWGVPEKIYLPVGGNDNLHIDNPDMTTTAGTPQRNATDGIWVIGMSEYMDITIDFIEMFAKIAPVEAVCFPGNHDENTSRLMELFLKRLFVNDKRVTVVTSLHPRIYRVYGRTCCIFTHGHHLGSKRIRTEIHKIILGEAKQNGINLNEIDNFLLFTGHDHVGSFHDLNGNVQHFVMPSLLKTDDFWHLGGGYVGRAQESAVYRIDPILGRKGLAYAR